MKHGKKILENIKEDWVRADDPYLVRRLRREVEEHLVKQEPQSAEEWAAMFGFTLGKSYPALCAYDITGEGDFEVIDDTLRFIRYDPDEKTLVAWSAQHYTILLIKNPLIEGGVVHYNDYSSFRCMTKWEAQAWDEMTRDLLTKDLNRLVRMDKEVRGA